MAKIDFSDLQGIDGYIAGALVDLESGMLMAGDGNGVDLELAAAGNADVIKAKARVVKNLQLNDTIEDVLISLSKQYHLIRPLETNANIFLYLMLDKSKANLAMARHVLRAFERKIDFS